MSYEVQEMTNGTFAVVNSSTGAVRNEALSREDAIELAAELNDCDASDVAVLEG